MSCGEAACPTQLLVIEDKATPAEASVRAMLGADPAFCCEPLAWNGLVPESLNHRKTQAVVAVAVPHTLQHWSFLTRYRSGKRTRRLNPVIPAKESVDFRRGDGFLPLEKGR